jgi:endonuclease/exonuclease/phosphatase family metal-dependent hydrolase
MAEVGALRPAIARAVRTHDVDGVIVAGDFNLVGSRAPLDLMRRRLDLDGSDLDIVEALTLDGGSKDTWRSPAGGGAFPPGPLDWMLLSGSSVDVRHAFVFDTEAIGAAWLKRHGLRQDDSRHTSDHLPIVADLQWR